MLHPFRVARVLLVLAAAACFGLDRDGLLQPEVADALAQVLNVLVHIPSRVVRVRAEVLYGDVQ